MTKFGLGKLVQEEGTPKQKSEEKLSGVWDLEDLCVFPQVEIPVGFKIPAFVKYDGTTNPKFHLKGYCLTMGKWGQNEKFFLAHFHFSLTGFAFQWYLRLGKESFRSWHDMVQAFLKQFKHSKIELTCESIQKVPDDPTSFTNRLNQPIPITLNTSSLFVAPCMPTKISPFSLDAPYLLPLPEYQKAIELFNVPTIP
ncbi:putative Gag-pro [Senna tora]|uniref:Putative Gag-pro n=1 Tax=Senna tora TaxID=362788 RepID=A0A834WJJ8_9FABA|nr:putative Gag-pro [Senna tora]